MAAGMARFLSFERGAEAFCTDGSGNYVGGDSCSVVRPRRAR